MSPWRLESIGLALALLALGACQPRPGTAPDPPVVPAAESVRDGYIDAARQGAPVYRIDRPASSAVILVRRAGPLARFGHDHAIVAGNIDGWIAWPPGQAGQRRADLWLDVAGLEVDPAAAREEFALDTSPDEAAIAGTRNNMLQHVLQASRWPRVRLQVAHAGGAPPDVRLNLTLELNGAAQALQIPAQLALSADALTATGTFTLQQSAWGIEPYSALGGGLRVADQVEIHFRLAATRLPDVPE